MSWEEEALAYQMYGHEGLDDYDPRDYHDPEEDWNMPPPPGVMDDDE